MTKPPHGRLVDISHSRPAGASKARVVVYPILAVCAWGLFMAVAHADDAPSATPGIVPQPASLKALPGAFAVSPSTIILYDEEASGVAPVAAQLAEHLRDRTGYALPVLASRPGASRADQAIVLTLTTADRALGDEGHTLQVSRTAITLTARTPEGLFRGVQTIRQLLSAAATADQTTEGQRMSSWHIPCVQIRDVPRFRWRGMLLDCGRHFMPVAFVKRYIDLLAYHKMNILHWHLTEDQGWRLDIKKYPRLTKIGAWRTRTRGSESPAGSDRYGGYYSQEEVREIVAYAQSRFVTVVPEIEMPGHCLAALASYPSLGCTQGPYAVGTQWGVYDDVYCAGNEEVFTFLENVLTEVMDLFPSAYIHIGGDECPKARWKTCANCQARLRAEGLRDEHELQSYFIRRIETFLSAHGRRIIGWDEIIEGGLAPDATVQSWRGMDGAVAAARAGHDVVVSPTSHCYLDYPHDAISLERVYSFEPVPDGLSPEQARHILGAEGNIWTERAPVHLVDRQVFPRLCALAEVTWSPRESRNLADFQQRMKHHYSRLDTLGVAYHIPPPRCTSRHMVFEHQAVVELDNPVGRGVIRFALDGQTLESDAPVYDGPMQIHASTVVRARTYLPDGRASEVATFRFRKCEALPSVDVPAAQPGLVCTLYKGHWDRLPDFANLTPADSWIARNLTLEGPAQGDGFALRFSGYIRVPKDGVYTFFLTSDDGSRLSVGGNLVVDHDGLHAATQATGQIILQAGCHPITVAYFEAGGAESLSASYEGPGITRQVIPQSAWTHD